VVKLIARTPAQGLLPVTIGALTLSETVPDTITAVMPFAGQGVAVCADLGLALPDPNRTTQQGETVILWAGQNMYLVLNGAPESAHAAISDHSDAWAVFALTGPGGDGVLARLSPIDTRPEHFATGHTARTLLGHMNASVTRLSDECLRIMVYRSMAQTAVHDLTRAMEHAAR